MIKSTRKILTEHIKDEDVIFKDIKENLIKHKCPFSDGEVIELLKKQNKEQNGHMKDLTKQEKGRQKQLKKLKSREIERDKEIKINSETLTKILGIAEGRKSMWLEIGVLTGILVLIVTIVTLVF